MNEKKYKDYESVKCINGSNSTAYVLEKNQYSPGASRRRKTIEHYMGCKLETNGNLFGFLNIEFHNGKVFLDEDSMQEFMEQHVFPFKLLLEYQYLKKSFFGRFNHFDKYWRVA
jgi:hypothetical protein